VELNVAVITAIYRFIKRQITQNAYLRFIKYSIHIRQSCLCVEPICQSHRSLEKITSVIAIKVIQKLISQKKKEKNSRFCNATREIAKMVNNEVGPSQFKKLRFHQKTTIRRSWTTV